MTSFVAIAAATTVAALAFILRALWLPPGRPLASRKAANLSIHAEALATLEHDLQAGLLDAASHADTRDEILRSALVVDAENEAPLTSSPRAWIIAALVLCVPITALFVYAAVGEPAAIDYLPGDVLALESHLQKSPRDARAWIVLARTHMDADRFVAAIRAYERALAANANAAADPQLWCELADAAALAQGGVLAGRPRELIEKALALRPLHPRALEMAGSAALEAGEYDSTLAYWTELLGQLPPQSDARRDLQLALQRLELVSRR